MMKVNTLVKRLIYWIKKVSKKLKINLCVTKLLGITSSLKHKSFAIKFLMKEEIYKFIKESIQAKSLINVSTASRCLQPLETEMIMREDILKRNLTFAI